MNSTLEQKLRSRPVFADMRDTRFWCGDGWFGLLNMFSGLLTAHILATGDRDTKVIYVKEKFGSLVIHTNGSWYTKGLCDMAHACSAYVCESCGSLEGELGRTWSSVMTRCPQHQEDPWSKFDAGPKITRQIDIPGHPVLELVISRWMTKRPQVASVTYNPASETPFIATIDEKAEVYWQEIARGAMDFAASFYRKYE